MSLLSVNGLSVNYRARGSVLEAVQDVSFEIAPGEVLGLVGESGSGKTTLGRALLRLLPRNGFVDGGSVMFDGRELTTMTDRELRKLRWNRMAMVFQGAMNTLDPVYPVGQQIVEAIRVHRPNTRRREASNRAEELLDEVGIDPSWCRAYPHTLSGGMKQRINIAMALALEPDLIIADEPTTALDVISQDNVMKRLLALQREHGTALILISHDMGLIAENCERAGVMYAGRLSEIGSVLEVFDDPAHPYTMGLINAIPKMQRTEQLVAIPGFPPPAHKRPDGCLFEPRCPFSVEICQQETPPWVEVAGGHEALCHFTSDRQRFQVLATDQATWDGRRRPLPGGRNLMHTEHVADGRDKAGERS